MLVLLAVSATARADDAPVPVPEPTPQALRYYHSGNRFWIINQLWAVAVPAAILGSGLSARLRTAARRAAGGRWMLTISLFGVLYLGLNFLIDLPLDFCQTYIRPHAYGLSNQSPARWLEQQVKALFVAMAGAFLFLWIPYLLMARSPRRWWLYAGLLTIPFGLFGALIQPVLIDPLFHHYGPMRDTALEARILDQAARAGIDQARVFEVDMSRDTKAVNAYVKGFLGTHRIVLWDTLLAKLEPEEALFVMAHEMGHYVLGHIVNGIIVSALLSILGLFVVDRAARWAIARWHSRFGFDRLEDIASLPLVLLFGHLVALALVPVGYAFSRYQEHEADRFALELTRANRAGALAFVALQRENLSNPRPGPLYKLWRATHPSLAERIEFCNAYRPWRAGRPLRYARHFRPERTAASRAPARVGRMEMKDFGDNAEREPPD
jgi:Zn-dependent protease with chaperone function